MLEQIHPPLTGCDGLDQCSESCHYRQRAEARPEVRANFARLMRFPQAHWLSAYGPGTELSAMLARLGFPTCGECSERVMVMDVWGVGGVRERMGEVVGWLEAQAAKLGWAEKLGAGVNALLLGFPVTSKGLVEEAIRRAEVKEAAPKRLTWACGVTAVASRADNLLVRTLESLKAAGFASPRLFFDGLAPHPLGAEIVPYERTERLPRVGPWANWTLSVAELYHRNRGADLFGIFQDDLVCVRGLADYIASTSFPLRGYLNLLTFMENEALAGGPRGWHRTAQGGRGAVALVFPRAGLEALLQSPHFTTRDRGEKFVDGGIVESMNQVGWSEYVHSPSLVQHMGDASTVGNEPHPKALSFPGESFDAREWIRR